MGQTSPTSMGKMPHSLKTQQITRKTRVRSWGNCPQLATRSTSVADTYYKDKKLTSAKMTDVKLTSAKLAVIRSSGSTNIRKTDGVVTTQGDSSYRGKPPVGRSLEQGRG